MGKAIYEIYVILVQRIKIFDRMGSVENEVGKRRVVGEALIRRAVYGGIEKRVKTKAGR